MLVDMLVFSLPYTIRVFAGSAASGVPLQNWLDGFSVFFLSLAFVKRFAELEGLRLRDEAPLNGRATCSRTLSSFGTSAAYASVRVLMFYISGLNTHLDRAPAGFGCCCRSFCGG